MIRPRSVKDYLKWVFCLHKAISKIHHFFNIHKVYVYTEMKFSNFSRLYNKCLAVVVALVFHIYVIGM